MEIKVGDKVTFRNDLKIRKKYGGLTLFRFMSHVIGKTFVVAFVTDEGNFYVEKQPYIFSPEMLVQHEFRIGDKVIGNARAKKYELTGVGWVGTVADIYGGGRILVRKDLNGSYPSLIVDAECFDLYEPARYLAGAQRVFEKPSDDSAISALRSSEQDKRITVTVHGRKTVAKLYNWDGKVEKVGVAKCSPDDNFDFEIGARLAFIRLFEDEKPLGCYGTDFHLPYYGKVGKLTELKDINGNQLFVGDAVEVFDEEMKSWGLKCVCNDDESGDFIMGIAFSSETKKHHGEIVNGFRIIKRKSHKDMRDGDKIGHVTITRKGGETHETHEKK